MNPTVKITVEKPLVQTIKDDENELSKMGMQVLETWNYDWNVYYMERESIIEFKAGCVQWPPYWTV